MSKEALVTSSDFHVRVYGTQLRRRGPKAPWEVSSGGSDYVPFPMRNLHAFVRSMTVSVCEELVKESSDRQVLVSDQVAARLHVAGVLNLRDAHVVDGAVVVRRVHFGDYEVTVRIIPTLRRLPGLALGYAVVRSPHKHLTLLV